MSSRKSVAKRVIRISVAVALASVLSLALMLMMTSISGVRAAPGGGGVVISQVYGGGGASTGAPAFRYDYVELFNAGTTVVTLSNYSLQYGSSSGNFASISSNLYTMPVGTVIQPGQYLLVQLGPAGSAGPNLSMTPDFTTTNLNMSAASGKVALANVGTALGCGATATPCALPDSRIVDLVAYGASNNAEGNAPVNNGVALDNTKGGVRKLDGCQDTDNNNNDFTVVVSPTLIPRNSSSSTHVCGLQLTKSAPSSAGVDTAYTYTLVVVNATVTGTDVVITDLVPSNATYVPGSASDGGALESGNVVSWTIASLSHAATITRTFAVTAPTLPGSVVNQDYRVYAANLVTPVLGAAITTQVQAGDLTVNKFGPTMVMPGARITYTLRVNNIGIANTSDLIVTDTLPSGVTFVTDTTGVAYTHPSAGVYVWNLPGVSASDAYTFDLACDIGSLPFGTTLTNTVDVATSGVEESAANNEAQLVSSVGGPNLVVSKDAPVSAVPGDVISFTLRVWNVGSIEANNIWLTDTLPGKVAYASDSLGYTLQSGQDYGWSLGTLAPGLGITFTVNVTVSASAYGGDVLVNTAQVSEAELDQDQTNNITTTTTTILGADPHVLKTGPAVMVAGDVASYNIVYGNSGNQTAVVTITDTLPAGFTVSDIASDTSGLTPVVDAGNTRAWATSVASGDRFTFTLALTVPVSIPSGTWVTNTAQVATSAVGNDPSNDVASASSKVYQVVPIATARAGSIGQLFAVKGTVTAEPGIFKESSGVANRKLYMQDSTAGILVYLAGGLSDVARSHQVLVIGTIDVYRTETEFVPASTAAVIDLGPDTPVSPIITYTGAVSESLEGELVQVEGTVVGKPASYRLQVDDGSGIVEINRYVNLGLISDPNYIDFDQFQVGDYVRATGPSRGYDYSGTVRREILPRGPADLWRRPTGFVVSKTAPDTVLKDSVFTYTLVARNDIGAAATDVLITDSLPLSLSVGAVSDGGEILSGNVVSWSVTSLAQGASITRTVAVTAPGSLTVLINSDYGVSASEYVTRVKGLPVTTRVVLRDCSICKVQGGGDVSPYAGQVVSVTGVIYDKIRTKSSSGTDYYGFFMQARAGTEDGDPATSDGLFVYLNTDTTIGAYTPAVGDEVIITGTVDEYYGLTELTNPTLIANLGQVPNLNAAVPPTEIKPLDDATADNTYRETLESMRVSVPGGSLIVAPTYFYVSTSDTEFYVIRGDHPVAQRADPFARRVFRDGEALDWGTNTDGNSYRISVEANVLKGNANDYNIQMPRANVYDVVTNTLVGPLTYAFSRYTLMVENTPAISTTVDASTNAPPQAPDRLRQYSMATLNMENLYDYLNDPADGCDFLGDPGCPGVTPPFDYVPADLAAYQTHLAKLAQEVIAAQNPDILAVEEAEDQDVCAAGGEIYGKCSITSTIYADGQLDVLQDLAREIYIRSGSVISYQTATDRAGVDYRGIIVGYLYRADRVELVPAATLSADPVLGLRPTDPYTYTHNKLVLNPKALQATASVAAQADGQGFDLFERLPQVALFRVHHVNLADSDFVEVYAIGNHFKSSLDSYVQRRAEQASYNDQLVADILAMKPNARVAVLGDLNVYPDSAQLAGLYNRMSNLHYEIPAASRYSYVYQGQTQTLDQIFVTSALSQALAAARAAHVNADWSYDYQTLSTTIHQASDHDPVVATFNLPAMLSVAKSVTPNSNLIEGSVVTYTITLSNSGGSLATGVVLTDVLPAGVDFGDWLHQGSAILPPPGRTVNWGPYTLQSGDSLTLSFTAIVTTNPAYYGATVDNTVQYAYSEGSGSASAPFTLAAAPSLNIAKHVTPVATVLPGGAVTYTVVLSNSGGSPANNVALTDILPVGVDFGAWVQQGAATLTGRTVTWGPNTLPSDGKVTLSFTSVVTTNPAYLGAVITNTAQYASTNAGSGNHAVGFTIASAPALATSTKTASASGQVKPGDLVTYTITLNNTGGTDAAVRITDTLVSAYTVLNRMSFTESPTGTLAWQGNVPAGRSVTLQFVVKVVGFTQLPIGKTMLGNSATVDDGLHTPFVLTAPTPPWVEVYGIYLPYIAKN
jgi:uncharacterized repeat protein (TIGR01451 family)